MLSQPINHFQLKSSTFSTKPTEPSLDRIPHRLNSAFLFHPSSNRIEPPQQIPPFGSNDWVMRFFFQAAGYNCEELLGDILAQSFEGTFVFRRRETNVEGPEGVEGRRVLVGQSEGVWKMTHQNWKKKNNLAILPFKQSFRALA